MTIASYQDLEDAVENWLSDTSIQARVLEFITLGEAWIWRNVRTQSMEAYWDLRLEAAQAGGTATGTANAILVAVTGFTGPALGDTVTFTAAATNTGTTTLNVESTGAVALNKGDGTEALEAGDIVIGFTYRAYHDGTRWRLVPDGAVPLPSRFRGHRRCFLQADPKARLDFMPSQDFWQKYTGSQTAQPKAFTIEGDLIVFGPTPDSTYNVRLLYWRRPVAISSSVPRLFTDNPDLYLYAALCQAAPYLEDDSRVLTWAGMLKQIMADIEKDERRRKYSGAPLQMRSDSPTP